MAVNLRFLISTIWCIPATVALNAQQVLTTADQLVYDHCGEPFRNDGYFGAPWGAHEGLLHGVPSDYDWYYGARPGFWFDIGNNQAVSTWGQVYEWAEESPVTGIRIQIRNHMLYAFTGEEWVVMEDGTEYGVQGSHWEEDFTQSYGEVPGRDESSNGGGESFPVASGRNLHWWIQKWPRALVPQAAEAFFVTCELRLIPGTDPDADLSQARYLAGVSADAYPTDSAFGPGPWPSLSISRHKFIAPEWHSFTAYIAGTEPSTVEQYRDEILSRPLPPHVTGGETQVSIPGDLPFSGRMPVIYPNPVSREGYLCFTRAGKEPFDLEFYTICGALIARKRDHPPGMPVPVHEVTEGKGVYILKMVSDGPVHLGRIVVQ